MTFPDPLHNHAAKLIADNLAAGLQHPGQNEPPTTIALPMFRTTGMPPEMAAAVQTSTRAIAEAIVYLLTVKNDLRLISATHYNQLQACHTSS
jgi:hypothetical protein